MRLVGGKNPFRMKKAAPVEGRGQSDREEVMPDERGLTPEQGKHWQRKVNQVC